MSLWHGRGGSTHILGLPPSVGAECYSGGIWFLQPTSHTSPSNPPGRLFRDRQNHARSPRTFAVPNSPILHLPVTLSPAKTSAYLSVIDIGLVTFISQDT